MEEGDVTDPDLSTSLIEALLSRKAELTTVKALLDAGADVNVKDSRGIPALLLAVSSHDQKYKNIALLLIERGAEVNVINGCFTPLHHAIYSDSLKIIRALLEKGADINACADIGCSPLMCASVSFKREETSLLIEMGADVTCQDGDKHSALHIASWYCWPDVVASLLERNSNPNQRDRHGQTPLHFASYMAEREVIKLLVKAGGDCHLKDVYGQSTFAVFSLNTNRSSEVKWGIDFGAEIRLKDFETFSKYIMPRVTILRRVKICTQAIMNNIKNSDLSLVNISPVIPGTPLTDKMSKVLNRLKLIIESAVNRQIQREGFFNVMQTRPCSLSMLCLRFLIDFPQ